MPEPHPVVFLLDDEQAVVVALAQIRLPIMVVTAHDQPALREQCLADGAVAYLAKPLQRERLVGLINDAIRLRSVS